MIVVTPMEKEVGREANNEEDIINTNKCHHEGELPLWTQYKRYSGTPYCIQDLKREDKGNQILISEKRKLKLKPTPKPNKEDSEDWSPVR